jgi:predicted RNA-binding Zn-ribbon protein involved in translation (DUF1610 family)
MLATRCTSCGSTAPLSLASPDAFTCPFCGQPGSVPPDMAAELRAAAAQLQQLDARERQLTDWQRTMLTQARGRWQAYLVGSALVLAPIAMGLVGLLGKAIQDVQFGAFGPGNAASLCLCILPVFLTAGGVAVGDRRVRAALERVKMQARALPPVREGQPHRCHVCGGPVAPTAGEAVARCPFCQADNLVDGAVRSEVAAGRERDMAGLAHEVAAEARRVKEVAERAQRAVLGTTVAAVVAGYGLGAPVACLAMIVVFGGEAELNRDAEYLWRETEDRGRCLAEVQRSTDGRVRLDVGTGPEVEATEADVAEAFGIEALEGQTLARRRRSWREQVGVVSRVYGISGGRNGVELTLEDGSTERVRGLDDLCLPD